MGVDAARYRSDGALAFGVGNFANEMTSLYVGQGASWQFTDEGLLPGLEAVLAALGVDSPWSRAAFFFSGDLRLDWRTPLEVLLSGDVEAVRLAAAAYGEQVPA